MPITEAPNLELGSAPRSPNVILSPSPSEMSSASSPEPQHVNATPLFRVLAMPPPEPPQPPGQDELERRLPGYRRIVIPRELTLIELLKQSSGVTTDEEVLTIREAKLRVVAERVGLRRLHVLAPYLKKLVLDGSAISSLRDLGVGLIHLKSLSVNRCGLSSLDGVWGFGVLRELHAAGNRLRDLHPLAALQKLNTLDLANNPLQDSSRLWTLGVCNGLRRLTLTGTPIADEINYRASVVSALPMLLTLDDRSINDETAEWIDEYPSEEDSNSDTENNSQSLSISEKGDHEEPQPGSSKPCQDKELKLITNKNIARQRPATTECAGARSRHELPRRPRTAVDGHIDAPTRLQIMNTLLEDEWCCSGSKLTSQNAVCGNIARALRKSNKESIRSSMESGLDVERTMSDACRALAAEIPRALDPANWEKFKRDTGIEIDIDFNERPRDANPTEVIDRLERIEKETMERLRNTHLNKPYPSTSNSPKIFPIADYDLWKEMKNLDTDDPPDNVNDLFKNIH